MKKIFYLFAVVFLAAAFSGSAAAYEVPKDDSGAEYFYVFGRRGSVKDGANIFDYQQVVFFDVPKSETEEIAIDVFDPNTGGKLDQSPSRPKAWETITQFAVYGSGNVLLEKKSFDESSKYDMRYYRFGPFPKEMGQEIGEVFRFKLVARPISTVILAGKDQNLFSIRVFPDNVEAFSDTVYFRLLPRKNDKMYFYPEIPAGASEIVTENYDIDQDGASVELYDPLTNKSYPVMASGSGLWDQTKIEIGASNEPRRLKYIITKKTQRYGNAAIRIKDSQGNMLPIYFSDAKRKQEVLKIASAPAVPVQEKPDTLPEEIVEKQEAPQLTTTRSPSAVTTKAAVKKPASPKAISVTQAKGTGLPCNKFTFDGTATYDPNNDKLSFLWDFGDGTTSTQPVVTHIFEKGGQYKVTMTVKDTSGLDCGTAAITKTVNVNIPPVPSFLAPEAACMGELVVFDADQTTDDTPENLTYAWDFGDATKGEGKQITKQYEKGGTYPVMLTVNDNAGTACSSASMNKKISVNTPPYARTGGNISKCLPSAEDYAVTFDASKSSDKDQDTLSYSWDFGDGESAQGKTITHTYAKGGIYTAKLRVDDGKNLPCSVSEEVVTVTLNRQPVASAGEDKTSCIGSEVVFDASGSTDTDNDELTHAWDFGDGETSKDSNVRHIYEKPGNYRAVLTVDDGRQMSCSTSTDSVNVSVNAAPTAILENVKPICLGKTAAFDASKTVRRSDYDYKFVWDFGDGTIEEGTAKAVHEYKKGGKFTVKVTADDKRNTPCSSDFASTDILVNTAPVAKAGPNFACCIDTPSTFDGSSSFDADGDVLSFWWDFGDGTAAQGSTVTHTYTKGGTYTVRLKVDDNSGTPCSSSETSFKVDINEGPVPDFKIK
jgi:PKD repeat protein